MDAGPIDTRSVVRHSRGRLSLKYEGPDPQRISLCQCYECQKPTGTVLSVQARVPRDQVRIEARTDAERLDAAAAGFTGKVLTSIQRASTNVLGVVLFASALFFGGMSTKLTTPRLRVSNRDALRRLRHLLVHGGVDGDLTDQPQRLRTRWDRLPP